MEGWPRAVGSQAPGLLTDPLLPAADSSGSQVSAFQRGARLPWMPFISPSKLWRGLLVASGGQDAGSENTRRPGTRLVYTRRISGLLRIPFLQRWLCQLRKPHQLAPPRPGVTRCPRILGAGPPLHPATCRRGGAQPVGYTPPSLPGSPLQVLDVMGPPPPPQPRLRLPLCNSRPSLGRGPQVLGGQAIPAGEEPSRGRQGREEAPGASLLLGYAACSWGRL